MDYATLKETVLAFGHRPDLTDEVPRFIALAEEMIRRDLRANVYTTTLDDDDRVEEGSAKYNLPSTLLEIRSLVHQDDDGIVLEPIGLHQIKDLPDTADPQSYAVIGDGTVEIRGTPSEEAEFELTYFGHPEALAADEDTNDLLTDHSTLYIEGALFHLYKFTQDLELAQGALDTFTASLEKLNEAAGRKLGGASVRPVYWFGPVTRGY